MPSCCVIAVSIIFRVDSESRTGSEYRPLSRSSSGDNKKNIRSFNPLSSFDKLDQSCGNLRSVVHHSQLKQYVPAENRNESLFDLISFEISTVINRTNI